MLSPLNSSRKWITICYSILFITLFFVSTPSKAQVQIWGTSELGGTDNIGSIFNILDTGTDYELKSEFLNNPEGSKTQTRLVPGSDGWYYGISAKGGLHDAGTIFRYSDQNGFELLYHLDPASDGKNASGDMVEVSDGVFVGTTLQGGETGSGTLFQFSLVNGFSVLHNFNSATEGSNPTGALAFDAIHATIYGACSNGGTESNGTCFAYNFNSGFSIIHHFEGGNNGAYPYGGVILSNDGNIYGTTQYGGANDQGSIFSISLPSHDFTVIYDISSTTSDGRYPYGRLIESSPGVFLGTCNGGGASANGTIFKVTSSGEYTRLKSLQPIQDGAFPRSGLAISDDGQFYGTTQYGGAHGAGTIYKITEEGIFTKIHDFSYTPDGSNPTGSLVSTGTGKLIGAAPEGGANNFGTLFEITSDEELVKLHDFSLPSKGRTPVSIIRNGNKFYGITFKGGDYNTGTFYKIELDGSRTKLHDFNSDYDGKSPNGSLFLAENGKYYGTCRFGGSGQAGTVFSISETGTTEVIHNFDTPENGQYPYGGVVMSDDGTIYGTTLAGGMPSDDGTLFSISPEGDHTVLYQFFGYFDGSGPEATLTIGSDGKIYGLNKSGGSMGGGTLFEYDPLTETFLVDHNFDPSTEGAAPSGKLLLHSDGHLYGTTTTGGINGGGSIFRYSPESGYETVYSLNPATDGSNASGGLAEDEQGRMIGFCNSGGNYGSGTCFSYSEADGFSLIYNFSDIESPGPSGTPALFFPECYGDEGCSTTDPCAVAICNFGLCEEIPINPSFSTVNIGQCDVGLDMYDLELGLTLDISPGGTITIAGQTFDLTEGVDEYQFTLINLPADAQAIDLDYTFDTTGCSGTTGNIGTAPVPCPPIEITFILDAGDLDVSPEGIHIGGSFQQWTPADYPMTFNNDGMWEATVTIGSGDYQFNFFNGSSIFDGEYVIGECATNGKRNITVGSESETLHYCWARCQANCSVGINELAGSIDLKLIPNITGRGSRICLEIPEMKTDLSYAIIDVTGKVLVSKTISGTRTDIHTDNLGSGMYNLILRTDDTGEIRGVKHFVIR